MKFKIGDNVMYQGEVGRVVVVDNSNKDFPYRVKFHTWGLQWMHEEELQEAPEGKTYTQGLADAWELARKIVAMGNDNRDNAFGYPTIPRVMEMYTAEEALAKIEAYEKEKEINPTDIVEYNGKNWVVTEVYKGEYALWNGKNVVHTKNVKKVGTVESIKPLEELLRQIGEWAHEVPMH